MKLTMENRASKLLGIALIVLMSACTPRMFIGALALGAIVGTVAVMAHHDAHYHYHHCGHHRRWHGGRWVYHYNGYWEYYDPDTGEWYYYED